MRSLAESLATSLGMAASELLPAAHMECTSGISIIANKNAGRVRNSVTYTSRADKGTRERKARQRGGQTSAAADSSLHCDAGLHYAAGRSHIGDNDALAQIWRSETKHAAVKVELQFKRAAKSLRLAKAMAFVRK
jgi:hypothetical protein